MSIKKMYTSVNGQTKEASSVYIPYNGEALKIYPLTKPGPASVIYGFHIDSSNSDPSASVTYLEDAVGMTPAFMDYSKGSFNYGSWEDAFFMPRPCMVKSDGTVDYYLDPNDYSKKEDGSSSDVANTSYDGNAMMEWGRDGNRIYYKVVPDTDPTSASVYISNVKVDDDYHDWSFINSEGVEVDHFYTPIYNGSLINSKLRSLSGQQVMNKQTGTNEISYAKANNPSGKNLWYTEVVADRFLINFLLVLMGKSLDTQTVFGQGLTTSGTEAINNSFRTGVHNNKGLFYGTNSGAAATYENAVKVFGMENWWGFQNRRVGGWVDKSDGSYVKLTYGTQDGSTAEGYNTDGTGYIKTVSLSANISSYCTKMTFGPLGWMVPSETGGSETTYFCDGIWLYTNNYYALVGGPSAYEAYCGAFSVDLSSAVSISGWIFGAALSLKPLA